MIFSSDETEMVAIEFYGLWAGKLLQRDRAIRCPHRAPGSALGMEAFDLLLRIQIGINLL